MAWFEQRRDSTRDNIWVCPYLFWKWPISFMQVLGTWKYWWFRTFLHAMFDSFRYHPQLELYAHNAFEGKGYSISHPPIYTHLETARFYSLYCRHPISNELSFTRIFTLFDYSRLELFSCPELQTKLNELFAKKKFRRAIEKIESNSARMYELFYKIYFQMKI